MRLLFFILSILMVQIGLSNNVSPKKPLPHLVLKNFPPPTSSYDLLLEKIDSDRRSLKKQNVSLDSCRRYFLKMFEYEVFPHWVGTTWDYNGYTNRPGEGKMIACGYFVSTPLKHMGFNWNRFKLAQMYSKNIVETLCTDMVKYTDKNEMIQKLESQEDHLYIIGLDNHVGMLLKSKGKVWFVHSNYINIKGPDKELAAHSEALSYSASYYIGTFSTNENMKKWLNGTLYPTE